METYKVVGIENHKVFNYLAAGIEVYAINNQNDHLINLLYETADNILEILQKGCYACFIVNREENWEG